MGEFGGALVRVLDAAKSGRLRALFESSTQEMIEEMPKLRAKYAPHDPKGKPMTWVTNMNVKTLDAQAIQSSWDEMRAKFPEIPETSSVVFQLSHVVEGTRVRSAKDWQSSRPGSYPVAVYVSQA